MPLNQLRYRSGSWGRLALAQGRAVLFYARAPGQQQAWNWVTFCEPATHAVTRESSDPETQLTR